MTERMHILLIEDSEADALLVLARLRQVGETIDVEHHTTLSTGSQRIAEQHVDAILLDLNLPDSAGLDTFQTLHAQHSHVPIVVLSGMEDRGLAARAVAAGAQDYLFKDHAAGETILRSIRYAVERQRRQLAERQIRATASEFNVARQIQTSMLPKSAPKLPGFDIAGACVPAEATGGDYFDYVPMKNGHLGVVVGDVSSHGFAPALIMSHARCAIRLLANFHSSLADILTQANRSVYESTQAHHFVTMFLAQIDSSDSSVTFVGAGHEAFLLENGSEDFKKLESTSYPLGLLPEIAVGCGSVDPLAVGQVLALFTDGFQEARNSADEFFGVARVLDVIRENRTKSAQQIVDRLFASVASFCRPQHPQDDVTAVIVKACD